MHHMLSCVRQFATPWIVARQSPLSMGFYIKYIILYILTTYEFNKNMCSVILVMSNSLRPYGLQPARLLSPWDSSGKNTGVGCYALLQGVFPTRGSNLRLLQCRQILDY